MMTKDRQADRGIRQDRQRRLRRALRQAPRPFPGLGGAGADGGARRRRARGRARHEDGRARRADLHQRRRPAARQSGVRAVLEGDEQDRARRSGCIRRAPRASPTTRPRPKSKYEIWWTLGWSYETAAAMSRLVFSKIMDKYPKLKIITHHFGGIVPMLEGRIGPGWDQIGARTSDEDLSEAEEVAEEARRSNYFKENFYCRHRGVRRQAGDRMRPRLLSDREARVRLGLPVRSGEGHVLHPRDAEDSRQPRSCRRPSTRRSCTATWRRSPAGSWCDSLAFCDITTSWPGFVPAISL